MTKEMIGDRTAYYRRADGTERKLKIKNVTGDEAEQIALASALDGEELMDLA